MKTSVDQSPQASCAPGGGAARWCGVMCSLGLLLSLGLGGWGVTAQPLHPSADVLRQITLLQEEKATRTPAERKIDSQLLLEHKRQRGDARLQALPALRSSVPREADGRILVDITADVTPVLLEALGALGGTVVNSFPQYQALRALLPLDQIMTLTVRDDVHVVRPADRLMTHKLNTSQGDVAHRAALARTQLGVTGEGVKLCVLSDSIEQIAAVQASGDLPNVDVVDGQAGSGTSEGTAMLEILHDLAPEAHLGFATTTGGMANFAQNILALNAAGCKVIVDNAAYFSEPVFQDGVIAQAINTVTSVAPIDSGSLYFTAAGNGGNLAHQSAGVWEGDFVATTLPAVLAHQGLAAQDFGGSNANTLIGDPPGLIVLQWSDPLGASGNDYDLFLLNPTGTTIYAASTNVQTGTQDPTETIDSFGQDDTNNLLVVVKVQGADRFLHLNTHGGRLGMATAGQIAGHAATARALSVAAVDVATASGGAFVRGTSTPVEALSADGPRRVFFTVDGRPLTWDNVSSTGGIVLQKPDLAAADGVATATLGFDPFFGTSAAAAHVAAVAGLMLAASPTLTQAEVRQLLTRTALDIEAPGVDATAGAGIVDALAAVTAAVAVPESPYMLVWRHSETGQVLLWFLQETGVRDIVSLGVVPLVWQIIKVVDMNRDGHADLLWRNTETGDVSVWFMQGTAVQDNVSLGEVPLVWQLIDVVDYNNDGHIDLVWRHSWTGEVTFWFMHDMIWQGGASLGVVPPTWDLFKVVDMNRDGHVDLLWRHSWLPAIRPWYMYGMTSWDWHTTIDFLEELYQFIDVIDMDHDGYLDGVGRSRVLSVGAVYFWRWHAHVITRVYTVPPLAWEVIKVVDVDRYVDGDIDIIWRNMETGEVILWRMYHRTTVSVALSYSLDSLSLAWQIQ